MQREKIKTDKEISIAMRKYQIGQECQRRLKHAEEQYIKAVKERDEAYLNTHKLNCKHAIATELAEEYHLSLGTILTYSSYADVVDEIAEKNEKLAEQILSGETKIGYQKLKILKEVL